MITKCRVCTNFIIAVFVLSAIVVTQGSALAGYTIDMELSSGRNFISLPVNPIDTDITVVTSSIEGKLDSIWSYQKKWKSYKPNSSDFSDLTTMESGYGYLINMKTAGTLTITAASPEIVSSDVQLFRGLNFVGFKGTGEMDIKTALASVAGLYSDVFTFENGELKDYNPDDPGNSELMVMKPGKGYWINATAECVWTLPKEESGRLRILIKAAGKRSARRKPGKDKPKPDNGNNGNNDGGNITEIWLDVKEVAACGGGGGCRTVGGASRINLMGSENIQLADVYLPEGNINQLRLVLGNGNEIVADGVTYPLKTPSGQQSGIKLKGDWPVEGGKLTTIVIDFDPDKSVVYNKGQGYILKPVIKVVSAELTPDETIFEKLHYTENVNIHIEKDNKGNKIAVLLPEELEDITVSIYGGAMPQELPATYEKITDDYIVLEFPENYNQRTRIAVQYQEIPTEVWVFDEELELPALVPYDLPLEGLLEFRVTPSNGKVIFMLLRKNELIQKKSRRRSNKDEHFIVEYNDAQNVAEITFHKEFHKARYRKLTTQGNWEQWKDIENVSGKTFTISGSGRCKIIIIEEEKGLILDLKKITWKQEVYIPYEKPVNYDEIAKEYLPIAVFHDDESYFPMIYGDILSYGEAENEEISIQTTNGSKSLNMGEEIKSYLSKNGHMDSYFNFDHEETTQDLNKTGALFIRNLYGNNYQPVVYYDIATVDSSTYLSYYFIYSFDPKTGTSINPHTAAHAFDRENFTIEFDENMHPVSIVMGAHLPSQTITFRGCDDDDCQNYGSPIASWSKGKVKIPWKKAQKLGTHPIVYIARGAHAVYPLHGWYQVLTLKEPAYATEGTKTIYPANWELQEFDMINEPYWIYSGYVVDVMFPGENAKFPPFFNRVPASKWVSDAPAPFNDCLNNENDDSEKCKQIRKYFNEKNGIGDFGAIYLKVTDKVTGNPITSANILIEYIENFDAKTYSDGSKTFILQEGIGFKVTISKDGYNSEVFDDVTVKKEETKEIFAALQPTSGGITPPAIIDLSSSQNLFSGQNYTLKGTVYAGNGDRLTKVTAAVTGPGISGSNTTEMTSGEIDTSSYSLENFAFRTSTFDQTGTYTIGIWATTQNFSNPTDPLDSFHVSVNSTPSSSWVVGLPSDQYLIAGENFTLYGVVYADAENGDHLTKVTAAVSGPGITGSNVTEMTSGDIDTTSYNLDSFIFETSTFSLPGSYTIGIWAKSQLNPNPQNIIGSFQIIVSLSQSGYFKPLYTFPETGGYIGFEWGPTSKGTYHNGADFASSVGENVYAVAAGNVIYSKEAAGFGSPTSTGGAIIIRHQKNDGSYFYVVYGHLYRSLQDNTTGQPGEHVSKGQIIGTIRPYSSSNGTSLPHLHLGVYDGSTFPSSGWGYSASLDGWHDPKPTLDDWLGQ